MQDGKGTFTIAGVLEPVKLQIVAFRWYQCGYVVGEQSGINDRYNAATYVAPLVSRLIRLRLIASGMTDFPGAPWRNIRRPSPQPGT
jgi:hypothetical protein